eukprot:scaffold88574_cov30-Tisochrysis_lutea.AAC.1
MQGFARALHPSGGGDSMTQPTRTAREPCALLAGQEWGAGTAGATVQRWSWPAGESPWLCTPARARTAWLPEEWASPGTGRGTAGASCSGY